MELTKQQIKITKGIAILFMLLLHLFCKKNYQDLYTPILFIKGIPLVYYLALFGDCCVAIYCFCSGYGLLISYKKDRECYFKNNLIRIGKLYINYWIILIIFVVILGPLLGKANSYPGSLKDFILTFTGIDPAYNGAWWFFTTYIFLVLSSSIINKAIIKHNSLLVIVISFGFYIISYIQRIKGILVFENWMFSWIVRQVALWGTSQFPFIIGAVFLKENIYSKIYNISYKLKCKKLLGVFTIIVMIIAHGIIETLFVAVFTGVIFICAFNIIDKPKWVNNLLDYLGNHSTNMWLIHMFFYMIYFKDLVYGAKYSVLIFVWLLVLCIASSYVVNFVYKLIIKLINNLNLKNINYVNSN